MKFLHLADLHIGKRVCEHSMLDEQVHILGEVLDIARKESPDAVLIAGDVYDKSVPSAEAVAVLDDFLVKLAATGTKVFVLSGTHRVWRAPDARHGRVHVARVQRQVCAGDTQR